LPFSSIVTMYSPSIIKSIASESDTSVSLASFAGSVVGEQALMLVITSSRTSNENVLLALILSVIVFQPESPCERGILTRLHLVRVVQQASDFHDDGAKSIWNGANVHSGLPDEVCGRELEPSDKSLTG
jgi:hypothetical protein